MSKVSKDRRLLKAYDNEIIPAVGKRHYMLGY